MYRYCRNNKDLYLTLSPQYATLQQATIVNKQPNPCHQHNKFNSEGKFIDFKIIQLHIPILLYYLCIMYVCSMYINYICYQTNDLTLQLVSCTKDIQYFFRNLVISTLVH